MGWNFFGTGSWITPWVPPPPAPVAPPPQAAALSSSGGGAGRWSPGSNWRKAKFVKVDGASEVQMVECHFNPEQYAISQSNQWKEEASAANAIPNLNFTKTGLKEIKNMTVWFDTYEDQGDVSMVTKRLFDLMAPPGSTPLTGNPWIDAANTASGANKPRPPQVAFRWGSYRSFTAVITQMTQTFTLFLPDGTPVRAKVAISLKEVPPTSGGQNPTSRATGARRVRMVQLGDTLDIIASQELGDPNSWRFLAELNDIDDPRRIRPGQLLLLPTP